MATVPGRFTAVFVWRGACFASAVHKREIDHRASRFFEDVVLFTQTISPVPGTFRTIEQLVSAAGSIPANRCEATEGSSRREFIRFNKLALRGARESEVWLREGVRNFVCGA